MANIFDMTEAEWLACDDARRMLGFCWDTASDRKLRLFAVACCQCSRQLLLNKDHRHALEVSTRFADGQATEDELAQTHQRANDYACELYRRSESEKEIHRWAEATAVANATAVVTPIDRMAGYAADAVWNIQRATRREPNGRLAELLREILGPLAYHSLAVDPAWRTSTVMSLAQGIYDDQSYDRLPILADALEEAGCDDLAILEHCRGPGPHVRGCWVVDLVLGKS